MERPIIFNTENVKAILDGKKTMTRWVIKVQPPHDKWRDDYGHLHIPDLVKYCPHGQIGDRLWVRETWAVCSFSANFAKESQLQVAYRAGTSGLWHPEGKTHDLEWRTVDYETWQKYATQKYYSWQPSLFMPKKFARIWCEITGLRVERLQEITEEDAKTEGVLPEKDGWHNYVSVGCIATSARQSFISLWQKIHLWRYEKNRWENNPWVWVIKFDNIGVRVK